MLNHIPNSPRDAGSQIRHALAGPLGSLPKQTFLRAWSALSYLYPGLHPDGYEHPDSGWPRVLKPFAAEAWHRAEAGELHDDELHCSDAAWSGIFDRMVRAPTAQETARRVTLASHYGLPVDEVEA